MLGARIALGVAVLCVAFADRASASCPRLRPMIAPASKTSVPAKSTLYLFRPSLARTVADVAVVSKARDLKYAVKLLYAGGAYSAFSISVDARSASEFRVLVDDTSFDYVVGDRERRAPVHLRIFEQKFGPPTELPVPHAYGESVSRIARWWDSTVEVMLSCTCGLNTEPCEECSLSFNRSPMSKSRADTIHHFTTSP